MKIKLFWFFVFLYGFSLVGMSFVGLGKFAAIAFKDGWWVFLKDLSSILGEFATALGLPLAIYMYFKGKEKDRADKWHEQARGLLGELILELTRDKLLSSQLTINSLLYRLRSYIGDFDAPLNNDYLFSLRTHLNQLFLNLERDSLFKPNDPAFEEHIIYSSDLSDLSGEKREITFGLAQSIAHSKCYKIHHFGKRSIVSFEGGFEPQLLSRLVLIAQPICSGNFTAKAADVLWKQESLKELFTVLPDLVASYIYLAYSTQGHDLIIKLDAEFNNKKGEE